MVIGGLMPVLTNIGYTVDWKQVTVITWGGLRGAVGLALALVVAQTPGIPHSISSKILFHSAGIVMLTLIVNATTTKYLLAALGMSDISHATRVTMAQAVRRVREAKQRAVSMLKSDHFLADANWEMVEKTTEIRDPYRHLTESVHMAKDGVLVASVKDTQQCPKCETLVPRIPHPKELAELAEEVRQRMIKAERTSYWRQFEQGMLGRDAVLVLIHLADTVLDTPERLITLRDLSPYWQIPLILKKIRQWLLKAEKEKASSEALPAPNHRCCLLPYFLVNLSLFEWTLFGIITLNGACTIAELATTDTLAAQVLEYINYVFVAIYIVEAFLKIVGLRKYYFLSKWNLFDLLILAVSLGDVVLELSVPQTNSQFSSAAVLRLVRIFRIMRVSRVLRLLKVLLPVFIHGVDNIIHRRLRFGYDVGKGFVMGEEEMLKQFDRFGGLVHKKIALELRRRAEETRLDVIKSLGHMRKQYPGVALSVKTHQATRSVLNHCRDTIKSLLGSGLLDEDEAEKLFMSIEKKMKHLERTPGSLRPPDPATILLNLPWLSGLGPDVVQALLPHAEFVQLEQGDWLLPQGAESRGIYVIVSGLVKLTMNMEPRGDVQSTSGEVAPIEPSPSPRMEGEDEEEEEALGQSGGMKKAVEEFHGAGSVLGELGVLENASHVLSIQCETPVRAFFLDGESMRQILQQHPVVEERLWRVSGIRTALQLLPQLPEYQDWPMTKLMLMCEGAYIATPPDEPAPTFEVTQEHHEVILISGEVRDVGSRERLVAPCVVPNNFRHLMMNVGSPRLLVISDSDPVDQHEEEEEELTFKPHVTHRQRLRVLLLTLFSHLLSLLHLIGVGLRRLREWRRRRVADDVAEEEEGRGSDGSRGSLNHTPQWAESEMTPETLQLEMEAATPLPGENVTMPPGDSPGWAPRGSKDEDEENMDPTSVPLPASNTSFTH
jgi:sodium/hydrogen exchanger 10/11